MLLGDDCGPPFSPTGYDDGLELGVPHRGRLAGYVRIPHCGMVPKDQQVATEDE